MPVELQRRDFESEFFDLEIARVGLFPDTTPDQLQKVLDGLPESGFAVVEANVNLAQLSLIKTFEACGFRTSDSRITFMTKVSLGDPVFDFPTQRDGYTIRDAEPNDLSAIVAMTHSHLTDNPTFVSRYKDETVFGPNAAGRWFESWIVDVVSRPDSRTAVSVNNNDVVGFFSFARAQDHEPGEATYKGILVSVDERHRGSKLHLAMQSYLFHKFGQREFWIDNTTQLSNYAVIKNHVRSNRTLQTCELSLIWTAQSPT